MTIPVVCASRHGIILQVVRRMPGVRKSLPAGDFRDWPATQAWADTIAAELGPPGVLSR